LFDQKQGEYEEDFDYTFQVDTDGRRGTFSLDFPENTQLDQEIIGYIYRFIQKIRPDQCTDKIFQLYVKIFILAYEQKEDPESSAEAQLRNYILVPAVKIDPETLEKDYQTFFENFTKGLREFLNRYDYTDSELKQVALVMVLSKNCSFEPNLKEKKLKYIAI